MVLPARRRLRALALALAASTAALALLLGATWVHLCRLGDSVDGLRRDLSQMRAARTAAGAPGLSAGQLLVRYELALPGQGQLFPAMAATDAPEYWPVATLQLTNAGPGAVAQTVSAEVPGWSLRAEQTVVLGAGETRLVRLQPELLPRAYENDEIQRAVLEVRATGADASVLYAQSRPLLIHGGAEIYWGRRFANARVSARWVTPHDTAVLELVSRSRRYVARGRLAGYGTGGGTGAVEAQVRVQAAAVYRTLQHSGLSYVNSQFVIGEHVSEAQRIRLPAETLRLAGANCMDLSVAYASALENLGLQALVLIVPGHAFAGVRLDRNSDRVLYLDLSALPGGSFEAAAARARAVLDRTPPDQVLVVDVASARALGVYPLAERTPARPLETTRVAARTDD